MNVKYFLFLILFLSSFILISESSGSDDFNWVETEKIRGGYLYDNQVDFTKVSEIHEAGLNSLIIKRKDGYPMLPSSVCSWAEKCKTEDIHCFIAFNFQTPSEGKFSRLRRVVFSDGHVGVAPCPFNSQLWEKYFLAEILKIAKVSVDANVPIEGMFLDFELYRTPLKYRLYDKKCCFCDNCFASFLLSQGYEPSEFPLVGADRRLSWLTKKNLLGQYYVFLGNKVSVLARDFERSVHEVLPKLILGVYPSSNGWVLDRIYSSLKSKDIPFLFFGTQAYSKGGYGRIPNQYMLNCDVQGLPDEIYSLGLLFRSYPPESIAFHCKNALMLSHGYWLWCLPQLWETTNKNLGNFVKNKQLYWKYIKKVNENSLGFDDISKLKFRTVSNKKSSLYKLPSIHFREKNRFVIYSDSTETTIKVEYKKIGRYLNNLQYKLFSSDGDIIASSFERDFGGKELKFITEPNKFYLLEIDSGRCGLVFKESNCPIGVLSNRGMRAIGGVKGLHWFLDEKMSEFSFVAENNFGWGRAEPFSFHIYGPSGIHVIREVGPDTKIVVLRKKDISLKSGLLKIELSGYKRNKIEDTFFYSVSDSIIVFSMLSDWVFYE